MTEEEEENICPLFLGGSCPACDEEAFTYWGKLDNKECCKSHYHPTDKDIEEMYGKK